MATESQPLPTILFVEPDEHRELFVPNLSLKYDVQAPQSLAEIWPLLDRKPHPLRALITASVVWGMSAEELISKVRDYDYYHNLPAIIFTANPRLLMEGTAIEKVEIVDKLTGDIGLEQALSRLIPK